MSRISGTTRLVGLIGYPVAHSLSPAMHNAAFAALGLDWCYVALPVQPERLEEAVKGLPALGFRGANVTLPYKEQVAKLVEALSPEAEALGAVNTLVVEEGKLVGHNSDWLGFLRALEEGGFDPSERKAVVLGAGGGARAVVYALARRGCRVLVLNRTLSRAEALVASLSSHLPNASLVALPLTEGRLAQGLDGAELLVNATSLGMAPQVAASPIPEDVVLPSHLTVFDLVYIPQETRLLQRARAAGARAIGGLGMLIYQGAEAFRLWTGQEAPIEVMQRAALHRLEREN